MEMYYLDIFDGHDVVRDEEGQEIGDFAAVQSEARGAARELVVSTIGRREAIDDRELRVRDASGAVVYVVRFADMID